MKQKGFLLAILAAVLFVVSCTKEGPTGPAGATGPAGSTGPQGQTGQQGNPGTANVIYSRWKVIDSSTWTYDPTPGTGDSSIYQQGHYNYRTNQWDILNDTFITFHAVISIPEITPGIKDSGLVYYYFKDSTGNGNPDYTGAVNQVDLYNFINSGLWTTTTNRLSESNHFNLYPDSDTIGNKLSINTQWTNSPAYYNNNDYFQYNPNPLSHAELKPKTKVYFRYIIIPGGKLAGGRMIANAKAAGVDFKNYKSVQQYFKIKD